MIWWLWVIVGLALLVLEMATPGGLFALFFGIGAVAVAPLAAMGLPAAWQWLAFSVISLVLLGTLRARLQQRLRLRPGGPPVDSLVDQEVVLLEDVPPGGEGKAELRGVPWTVRAAQGGALSRGQRCKVERVDGVVLHVKAAAPSRAARSNEGEG